jgi:hypothetical protein
MEPEAGAGALSSRGTHTTTVCRVRVAVYGFRASTRYVYAPSWVKVPVGVHSVPEDRLPTTMVVSRRLVVALASV